MSFILAWVGKKATASILFLLDPVPLRVMSWYKNSTEVLAN